MQSPGLVTTINGKNKTLYIATVKSIEEATKPNLKKTLLGKTFYSRGRADIIAMKKYDGHSPTISLSWRNI